MNKKRAFIPIDYWFLGVGIGLMVVGVLFYLATIGHEKLLIYALTGIACIGIIGGLQAGGFPGALIVLFVEWLVLKYIDNFLKPIAYILMLGGVVCIILSFKDSFRERPDRSHPSSMVSKYSVAKDWNYYKMQEPKATFIIDRSYILDPDKADEIPVGTRVWLKYKRGGERWNVVAVLETEQGLEFCYLTQEQADAIKAAGSILYITKKTPTRINIDLITISVYKW